MKALSVAVLGCLMCASAGCKKAVDQVNAAVWMNNLKYVQEAGYCKDKEFIGNSVGIYRKLNNGKLAFISLCNPAIQNYLAISSEDLNKLLEALADK